MIDFLLKLVFMDLNRQMLSVFIFIHTYICVSTVLHHIIWVLRALHKKKTLPNFIISRLLTYLFVFQTCPMLPNYQRESKMIRMFWRRRSWSNFYNSVLRYSMNYLIPSIYLLVAIILKLHFQKLGNCTHWLDVLNLIASDRKQQINS